MSISLEKMSRLETYCYQRPIHNPVKHEIEFGTKVIINYRRNSKLGDSMCYR